MTSNEPPDRVSEEFWRDFLGGGHSKERAGRKVFKLIHHGGAEIGVTMLFADVRGSTTLAEGMPSADFRRLIDRFYDTAATVVFDNDGIVDKFVGDELVAMFFPLLSGERHAARAHAAAAAGLDSNLERRPLELRGKQQITEVVALTVSPEVASGITAAPPSV